MSETAEFFLVVFVIYLSECVAWTRRTALGIRRGWGRSAAVHPPEFLGNGGAGLLVSSPLPFGDLFVLHGWPVAVGPKGWAAPLAQVIDPNFQPSLAEGFHAHDGVAPLLRDESKLLSEGAEVAVAGGPSQARFLCDLAAKLGPLSPEQRERVLGDTLDRSLDREVLGARLARYDEQAGPLGWACAALFVHCFIVSPIVALSHGLMNHWPMLLAGFGACWFVVMALFVRAHQRLYPQDKASRRSRSVMMTLMPLSAMQGRSLLGRGLFDGLDPVMAMAVLGGPQVSERVRAVQRDLAYPSMPLEQVQDGRVRETLVWFRLAYRERLSPVLAAQGFEEEAAVKAPLRESDAVAYCPRCHEQYVALDATCFECGDRAVLPFP